MLLNGAVMLNQPRQHHVGSAEALDFGEPIPASRGGKKTKRRQLGLHNHVQIACIYILKQHHVTCSSGITCTTRGNFRSICSQLSLLRRAKQGRRLLWAQGGHRFRGATKLVAEPQQGVSGYMGRYRR